MIVADTNLLAYLLLGGTHTPIAREVFKRDPTWAAPILWRSEFRSILAGAIRRDGLRLADAIAVQRKAEQFLTGREHLVESKAVLRLVAESSCSAYDCEFVALAQRLRVPLITSDKSVIRGFPGIAVEPSRFADSVP